MAVDKSALLARLKSLTADLQVSPLTSLHDLDQAHAAVAQALAAGQGESPVTASRAPAVVTARPSSAVQQKLEAAADSAVQQTLEPQFLVARREVPLAATGLSNLTPDWAAGRKIDRILGPFRNALGRPVWIDIFRIVRQVRLVRSPGAAPFATVPLRGLLISGHRFTLPAGSVWIASQQLAASAPVGGYTGLLIKGGTLEFSQSLTFSGSEIVVPPAVTCTLALDLDPGAAAPGTGPGGDARLSTAGVPKTATIVFSPAGAKIQSAGPARLVAYGSSVDMQPTSSPPTYVAALGRIFVPAKTDATSFAVTDVRSDLFVPAGTAAVESAAWTLPVAVTSPDSLGNAAGAGGLALVLKDGLTAKWKGAGSVATGPVILIADTGLLTFAAFAALGLGMRQVIELWSKQPGDPPSSRIEIDAPAQFPLTFYSSSAGEEILALLGSINASFDRPVTVAGNRVFIESKLALILFVESSIFTGVLVEAALDPPPPPVQDLAFAIANAVFRTTPANALLLVAAFDGTGSPTGGVAIGFGLQYLLPILPDPYAANVDVPYQRLRDTGVIGQMSAIVLWTPTNPPVLTYTLPEGAISSTKALQGAGASVGNVASGALTSNLPAAELATFAASQQSGALMLLDLSTNVDQFGVAFTTGGVSAAPPPLAVASMYLETRSNSVYVLTLPAVQWEPVFTETQLPPPSPPFPTPITFPNSGGPTAITVQSVALVPVAPAPALDNLVGNFTTSSTPQPAQARLTLPFGILAFSTWNKPDVTGPRGATVDYNRPQFTAEAVEGGHQISVRAVDPSAGDSPSFEGYTVQLRNALFAGVPANKSILDDDVDTIFNGYLGQSGFRPQVPVTRLDLSGYGESLFSNWLNDTPDAVAVTQARFDVLIGRTAYEVIQVRSILYPYGVKVVRTITIERKNSGPVMRKDSGWQAVSDGEYLFPGVGLTVHPGAVQRISNVTNIRDTGQFLDVGGAQVAGVLFDGDLRIDGVVKGASPTGVPARDQIGYVQLTPASSGSLLPAQYQQLIAQAGPLGGTIDCLLSVGGGGQLMKVGRVGVGVTSGMGGPEFVMTAWGSPQFPQGGQWSFLRQTGAGTAPEVVDKDLGVPLIRGGAAPAPPPLSSPYRFADPVDLSTPDTPASDYGVLHATGTQRVFFPRPKIEATAPDRITSNRVPILADPYSLANSVGFFPRTDSAVPFPSANYQIVISGGNYKLVLPSPSFPVTVGQRTISEAGTVRSYADYAGSTASVAIDTSATVQWTFQLKDVNLATSTTLMGEVIRVTATVDAASNTATALKDSNLTFGGALGPVQDLMTFLKALGLPSPLDVAMTNKMKFRAGLKLPIDQWLNKLLPPGGPQFSDTALSVALLLDLPLSEVSFELKATMLIPTPYNPLKAVGMFSVKIKLSTKTGTTFYLTVGVGVGVAFNVASFGCKAYFLLTMGLIVGDSVLGFSVGILIKGSIDLIIISASVSIEAKMAVLKVTCPDTTVWGAAQVTFAIDITIAWVISINFQVSAEADSNLNGGPCALPNVL